MAASATQQRSLGTDAAGPAIEAAIVRTEANARAEEGAGPESDS
jgi:hypothetical protein